MANVICSWVKDIRDKTKLSHEYKNVTYLIRCSMLKKSFNKNCKAMKTLPEQVWISWGISFQRKNKFTSGTIGHFKHRSH